MTAADWVDQPTLAAMLGIPAANLRAMRANAAAYRALDGLPAPTIIAGRPVWRRTDIDQWMTTRPTQR